MSQNNSNLFNLVTAFLLLIVAIGVILVINKLTTPNQIVLVDKDADGYFTLSNEGKLGDCNDEDEYIYPGAPEIEGDGIDQDCDGFDKLPEFDPEELENKYLQFGEYTKLIESGKYISLYENFTSPKNIDVKKIVDISRRIRTYGVFEKAYLFVSAGVENGELTLGESVYFYVDTGDKGGHLIKSKSNPIDNEIIENNYSNFLYKAREIPLTSLPYKENSTPITRSINLLEIINSENHGYDRKHYMGAFISSTRNNATIYKLNIAYECSQNSECNIELIK